MKYIVYFEFYGKNMKTTIEADSKGEIKGLIAKRININDIKPVVEPLNDNEVFDNLMDIFKMKK